MFKTPTRALALILALITGLTPAIAQVPSFPQTVPQQTVVGRLGIDRGPTQAIPIAQLAKIFGASRSVTTNAKCDGATDDTTAINADLAQGGYWTLPPNKTCNVTQLNITVSGTRLSGAGYNSSVLQGTTAAAPTINISATLSNVWLNDFQITKSVTATSGGNGIKYNGDCQYCVIDGVYAQKSYVGIAVQSTGIASMRHVLAQYNISDGITFTNSAVSGTLQWDLDDVFSGQNGGRGFLVTPSVAGPTGITLGSWHNVRTFANTGVGAAFVGTPAMPINGVRITKALFGQDGNHEVFLDTYGGLHTIGGLSYLELAGTSLTGPTFSTPASHVGDGIRITVNNIDVTVSDTYINGNFFSGINTSATGNTNVSGGHISNHSQNGILAADCNLINVAGATFITNATGNLQCTTNSGAQIVAGSYPQSVNNVVAAAVALGGISGLGTGVATALGIAVGSAGGPVTNGGALGTPSSGVGTNLTALNATQLTSGAVPAARMPALTGDVTSSAGSVALTLAAGNAGNLNSGTLLAARMPALTGDITSSAGGVTTAYTGIVPIAKGGTGDALGVRLMMGGNTGAGVVAAGQTRYAGASLMDATESNVYVPVSFAGAFKNLVAISSGAPGAGQTYTVTFRNTLAATLITCTISGAGSNSCSDTTHSATFSAVSVDRYAVQVIASAGAASTNLLWSIEFDPTP